MKTHELTLRIILALVAAVILNGCTIESSIIRGKIDGSSSGPTPTFPVVLSSAAVSPHDSSTISVTVDFGANIVTGLSAADFIVVNGTATNLVDTGGGTSFTIDLNPSGTGTFLTSIRLPLSVAKNAADENNADSNTLTFTIDKSGPTINIVGPSPATGTSATSFVFTVNYTDAAVVNLSNSDITLGGTDSAGCGAVVTNGTTTSATVTVTNCTGDGTMNISIAANTAQDAFGNQADAYGPSSNATVRNAFILSIDTRNTSGGSSGASAFTLPLYGWAGGFNFTVEWGDGNSNTVSAWTPSDPDVTHTYVTAGIYEVKIKGTLSKFQFRNSGDRLKILDVKQWGTNRWKFDMELMFSGCANLQITAQDAPVLTDVTSLLGIFQSATVFNSPIAHWNTSTITNMSNMFQEASAFNQPLSTWDTSQVTLMTSMFDNATVFNQNISAWNTANVTGMANMFLAAKAFNSPLPKSGSSWDTSKVTIMQGMFGDADAFNQDISSWVFTASLTNMQQMFLNADSFNQDLSGWVLPGGVNNSLFSNGAAAWVLPKPTFPP